MGFRPDLSDLGAEDSPNRMRHLRFGAGQASIAPNGRGGRFLIRDTWNTDIVAELTPEAGDLVLYKHRFSGFYETELDNVLHRLGTRNLIFTGCTTSICIDSTIRDAMFRDYRCVLLADCTGEPIGGDLARSNHEASLLTIQALLGWVSSSERFVLAIKACATDATRNAS
jgi:ureidoacrylate peracid hydrolase